jgi:hypothetical protein
MIKIDWTTMTLTMIRIKKDNFTDYRRRYPKARPIPAIQSYLYSISEQFTNSSTPKSKQEIFFDRDSVKKKNGFRSHEVRSVISLILVGTEV